MGKEKSIVVGSASPEGEVPKNSSEMEEFKERLLGSELLRDRVVSGSGSAAALTIEFKTGVNSKEAATRVREIVSRYQGPEEIVLAGEPYLNSAFSEAILDDLMILLPLVFLAVTFVLYLTFRSPREGIFTSSSSRA